MLKTAQANRGLGADAGLSDDLRFRVNVIRVIRSRLSELDNPQAKAPALFFLLPAGPPSKPGASLKSEPMLDNGVTCVEGHLWFVSPLARSGKGIKLPEWTDDATIFKIVVDDLAIGDVPAILLESRTQPASARFYPDGLADPERYEELRLSARSITIDDAIAVVDRVYEQSLATPNAQLSSGKLWAKPSKHWPIEDAEHRIQLQLRTGLIGAFPSCMVRAEQPQTSGRLDLEIEEQIPGDPSSFVRHLLLELKVLRSFGSTGVRANDAETMEWVQDGVAQAAAYADERRARARALLCFDMRTAFTGTTCFIEVAKKAKKLKVTLGVWHLFASSKSYREWLVSQAEAVASQ